MLSDVNVPVFAHTCETWDELISAQLGGRALPVQSPISLFGDLPVPRPTRQDVDAVLDYIRSTDAEPPFVELKLTFNTRSMARRLLALPAMTEDAKLSWQRHQYEATLARSVYPSFHAFTEALHQEVLTLSGHVTGVTDPESPEAPPVTPKLKKIRRSVKRDISPLFAQTVKAGRDLLDTAGEGEYRQLLNHLPDVQWTRRPVRSTYAVWVPRISGQSKGTPVIRVNRSLQAPATQVPAGLLRYLLWHELCHHVLPGHGHDAEFHRLLVMWPDFARLDHELDKLSERYDFGWAKAATR
ncbi:MAG: hypothetical protein DLM57_09345 [Pseudonocardiales bacterium]|nr:MAG: hypothetical protein DLM57_09345 [Pseudonocardiales bacterium]